MKLVTFSVEEKEYGVAIERVERVARMKKVTPVPDARDTVEGVITLRREILPLVNLRKKMKARETAFGKADRILVVRVRGHLVGMIVDRITDVLDLPAGQAMPPDALLQEASYLEAMAKIDGRLLFIIDPEKLFSEGDKRCIEEIPGRVEIAGKRP